MSYYHGLISSKKAESILSKVTTEGCFLIRDSQSQPGNFVLSVKYKGKVYHVLIFHEFGYYHLDSSESTERFSNIEELVLFGLSHELRVAGDEVILYEPILCGTDKTVQLLVPQSTGGGLLRKKRESNEDYDILTDLFASVFGTHSSVLVVVHSCLHFDGNPLSLDNTYLVCIVKDSKQKGFYIRTINSQSREMIGEKKITKHFEYDLPSDLVLTFLSEHGITCLGFKTESDRDMFVRHVDRIVYLQQEKAIKFRKNRTISPPPDSVERKSPTEISHPVRADDFDIYNISAEWQYLFDQSGVTLAMLEDKGTLQFILDKIYELGGAPKKFQEVKKSTNSSIKDVERAAAIAMDSTLRHESMRASKLADELRKCSACLNNEIPQPLPRKFVPPTCNYSGVCSRYKEVLLQRNSLSVISPLQCHCHCAHCSAGKPLIAVSGSPPHQYTMPIGWCQFVLRSQAHSLAQRFCSDWHVAFSSVPTSHVPGIIRTGRLVHLSNENSNTIMSPDIKWCKLTSNIKPELYYDNTESKDFRVNTAFQVFVQPGSYTVESECNDINQPLQQMWKAPERTYIIYALLIHIQPL